MTVVRVYGCMITDQHARGLIAALNKNGGSDAVAAADAISAGLIVNGTVGRLTPEMRDAILDVLIDPPNGLAGLQKALADDRRART